MHKSIITIGREFGSGGRTVGRKVAEALHIDFYDEELVKQVALESGFNEKYIEQAGEDASSDNWFSYIFANRSGNGSSLSMDDYLWMVQCEVIRRISEKPCVIVGRCGDYVLRDREDVLHVFIYADMDKRAERIVRLYGESEKSPQKRLEEKDKKRKMYHKRFTDIEWGDYHNYHLMLDSGLVGIDECANIIVDLVQNKIK